MSAKVDSNKFDCCSNCGVTLSPGTTQCPSCGGLVVERKPRSVLRRIVSWRHFRHALIVVILLLLPHVPYSYKIFPYRLLLPMSPLVLEAVTRANQHPGTDAFIGRPIRAGWLSRGYIWSDETGWSDYDDRRVSRVTLPDRGTYRFRYDYDPANNNRVLRSVVTAPDGSLNKFDIRTN